VPMHEQLERAAVVVGDDASDERRIAVAHVKFVLSCSKHHARSRAR
jgi:hypothetical protein